MWWEIHGSSDEVEPTPGGSERVVQLLAAKRDLRLPRELAKLEHVACLILDDIGYVQQI
jgi:hypothetical protein